MERKELALRNGGQRSTNQAEAHLWVCSGTHIGRRYILSNPQYLIGRSSQCAIEVEDDRISSQHAMIIRSQGRHVLRDLGSTNGTFVNNQQISEVDLFPGDLIQVGETVLEYMTYAEEPAHPHYEPEATSPASSSIPQGLRAGAQERLRQARYPEPGAHAPGPDAQPYFEPEPQPTQEYAAHGFPPPEFGQAEHGGYAPPRGPGLPDPLPHPMHVPSPRPAPYMGPNGPIQHPHQHQHISLSEEDEEGGGSGVDIKELLAKAKVLGGHILPYWPSIVALACVGALLGAGSHFLTTPKRTATFMVSLKPATSANPLGRFASNVSFFSSTEQNFRSAGLIAKSLKSMGIKDPSPSMIRIIRSNLDIESNGPPNPDTYRGSFTTNRPEPDAAVNFLKAHVKIYLDTEVDKTLEEIHGQAEFLRQELKKRERELKQTEQALVDFKRKNIDGLPQQAQQYYSLLFALERQKSAASSEIAKLSATRKLDSMRLRAEKPLVEAKQLNSRPYLGALVSVRRKLAEARAAGKGEGHPEVQRLKAQAQQLQVLAGSQNNTTETELRRNVVYDGIKERLMTLEVSERVARKEAGRINQDLKKIRKIVERLPELEATYSELTRSYDATKRLYKRIFDQLKSVEIQLALERKQAEARYDIITPPTMEFVSAKKTIVKRASRGGIFGLLLGLGLAGLRRFLVIQKAKKAAATSTALVPVTQAPPGPHDIQPR